MIATPPPPLGRNLSRRRFIASALAFGGALLLPPRMVNAAPLAPMTVKRLRLFNPKTKELLETTYWVNGEYVPAALAEIAYVMRDLRCETVGTIDTGLIDLLYNVQACLNLHDPIQVISGFRTRQTNERLRKQGWAAAKNSYHLQGQAVDIRLTERSTAAARRAAFKLSQGGVGYYPRLNFVHLDMGPVRYWRKE